MPVTDLLNRSVLLDRSTLLLLAVYSLAAILTMMWLEHISVKETGRPHEAGSLLLGLFWPAVWAYILTSALPIWLPLVGRFLRYTYHVHKIVVSFAVFAWQEARLDVLTRRCKASDTKAVESLLSRTLAQKLRLEFLTLRIREICPSKFENMKEIIDKNFRTSLEERLAMLRQKWSVCGD